MCNSIKTLFGFLLKTFVLFLGTWIQSVIVFKQYAIVSLVLSFVFVENFKGNNVSREDKGRLEEGARAPSTLLPCRKPAFMQTDANK